MLDSPNVYLALAATRQEDLRDRAAAARVRRRLRNGRRAARAAGDGPAVR